MEDEEIYFNFSASFRIMNAPSLYSEIENITGIIASQSHTQDDVANSKTGRKWNNDIWILKSPLDRELPLTEHLSWLWNLIEPHSEYFKSINDQEGRMDVFCGYRSNCDHAGFRLLPGACKISDHLNIPLEFSVIIA